MKPVPTTPGLLFGSFLYRHDLHSEETLCKFWESQYGKSFSLIPNLNPLAKYYAQEMGDETKLGRIFFLTSQSFPREFLLEAKLRSLSWENTWATETMRMVNVDIGILTLENFILATTKNFSHRQYLGQNIFGDLTYYFHQGKLQTPPWTYPDYQDEQKMEFFTWGRTFLLQSIQSCPIV